MFDKLVSALIDANSPLLLGHVEPHWLEPDEEEVFEFIRDYFVSYDYLPTYSVINGKFKTDYPVSHGRFLFHVRELRERSVYKKISLELPSIIRSAKKDPIGTLEKIREFAGTADEDTTKDGDVDYGKNATERLKSYQERVGTGGVTYLSTGDPVLDNLWFGYMKTDLITIAGRSGVGKTWMLLKMLLLVAAILKDDELAIVVTNEMSVDEFSGRLDCINFQLPYKKFLSGTLSRPEIKRFHEGLKLLEAAKNRIKILPSSNTLKNFEQKVKVYRPKVAFLDGAYMMEPKMQEGWEKTTFITRNLKQIAKNNECPIVQTTQLKKNTGTKKSKLSFDAQDDFAYGSSYVQDSDIAIRMYQTPEMKYVKRVGLDLAKGRRVEEGKDLYFENDLTNMIQTFIVENDEETTSISTSSYTTSEAIY